MLVWDLSRFRAHPGPTALEVEHNGLLISSGAEGGVKVWDPRLPGTGLVCKLQPHLDSSPIPTPAPPVPDSTRPSRSTASTAKQATKSTQAVQSGGLGRTPSPPISCMATSHSRGSSDLCYIVACSGGNSAETSSSSNGGSFGSSVAVIDVRQSFGVVSRWSQGRSGIYSLCLVGDEAVFVGDGAGQVLCYHLLQAADNSSTHSLRYAVGASTRGAVRGIVCVGGKMVAAGEDGKVMILDYAL
jgi:hypothetical protein